MDEQGVPVIPLPNEGEGGPVYPGDSPQASPAPPSSPQPSPIPQPGPGIPGGIVIQPLPGFIPIPQQTAFLRLLNSACGYPALSLYVGSAPAAGPLEAGSISSYVRVPSGRLTVAVTDSGGYIYLQTRLRFEAGERNTLAVLLRAGGLELLRIEED